MTFSCKAQRKPRCVFGDRLIRSPRTSCLCTASGATRHPFEPPEKEVSVIPASGHSICNPIRCRSCVMNGYLCPQLRAMTTDWHLLFGNKWQGLHANEMLLHANFEPHLTKLCIPRKKYFCPAAFASTRLRGQLPWGRTMQTYELYSVAFKSSGWHVCNSAVVLLILWNLKLWSFISTWYETWAVTKFQHLWTKDFLQQLLTKSDATSPVNTESSDRVVLNPNGAKSVLDNLLTACLYSLISDFIMHTLLTVSAP